MRMTASFRLANLTQAQVSVNARGQTSSPAVIQLAP
jgi:hypothetical protein